MVKKKKDTSDLQNRFTAYLVTAVINKKSQYLKKRAYSNEKEIELQNIEEPNICHFDSEFADYLTEQFTELWDNVEKMQELISIIDENHLLRAIKKLSTYEQQVLFAKIFKQDTYVEIAKLLSVTAKQAEATYYYAIVKIRRELEER